MNYKIILCAHRFYQEIELGDKTKGFKIGTGKGCEIRFSENLISEGFEIAVEKEREWRFLCSDSVLIKTETGEGKQCCIPCPGERLKVCRSDEETELFYIDFYRDFEVQNKNFDKCIEYTGTNGFTIGGSGCDIRIEDPVIEDDEIRITVEEYGLFLDTRLCKYGIAVNGIPVAAGKTTVKDRDFFSIRGFQFFVYNAQLYTTDDGRIATELPTHIIEYQKNHFKYPKFIKNVRQRYLIPDKQIEVLDPKALPSKPNENILLSLLPTVMSLFLIIAVRGSMGGGGHFVVYSAAMMGMGLVTSIISIRTNRKKYKKDMEDRERVYREYLAEKEKEIVELRNKEYEISCYKMPSLEENIKRVAQFHQAMFEKKKEHDDYMTIRLGKGVVKTALSIKYKEHEYFESDDFLMDYPKSISEKYEYIQDMPVTLNLKKDNVIGFVGTRTKLYQVSKNLILSLAIEHFYQDVKFFFVLDKQDIPQFEWARWLRNTYTGEYVIRNYMYDDRSGKIVLDYLYEELSMRESLTETALEQCSNIVIFVYRPEKISTHPIIQYVEKAGKLGFTFLFFEEYEELLNEYCCKRVFLASEDNSGYIQDTADGNALQDFCYEHVPADMAKQTALKLGCVYVDEVSLESALTKNISLFQLLNIMSVRDLELDKRWASSQIYETMAAPLGVRSDGSMVCLDIHERYHGPHGLVAGTTGSGKSEILQSYILSMATLFHPYEVGFIIIDFKGGGMVNQFRNLPHLNGAITNIDGKEINRSLLSIRAELHKRQTLFAEYEVNHIDDYIKKYKQGITSTPLPHLILIVDEFAELKSEQPEFMKELISAARIGRSLGVHLILATQKPSGVINEQIWSNSKFKLCLKVQTQSDSNEVIKSPLAAEIREPGRAYLQVGNNEIFQLFQSAYSGAMVPNGSMGESREFKISKIDLCGRREIIYEQKPEEEKDGYTQLQALVQYIEEFCKKSNIQRLPDICLPPLEAHIPYVGADYAKTIKDICVPIGVYDAPDRQFQGVIDVNISQNHVYIIGSSQTGKTNLLQCMLKGMVLQYSSDEIEIYLLDFATHILKNFENLKHVNDVIIPAEGDKILLLMKRLNEELTERKTRLSDLGLSSYSSYRDSGKKDMPQIVVMIDNICVLREVYPAVEESLLKLVREGSSVGICIVMTTQQSAGLGYRYLSNFGKRIALYCNDSGEYSSTFARCRMQLEQIPGRCIVELDKETYEGQIYQAFSGEKEIERVKEIHDFIESVNEKDCGVGGSKLPVIPEQITKDEVYSKIKKPLGAYTIPLGISYETMEVDTINLTTFPIMGMHGGRERIAFLDDILQNLWDKRAENPVKFYIMDGEQRELKDWSGQCQRYTTKKEDIESFLLDIRETSKNEHDKSFCYVILNDREVYEQISGNDELFKLFKEIIEELEYGTVSVLLADVPNENIMFHPCLVLRFLKGDYNLFIFESIKKVKLLEVSIEDRKKYENKSHQPQDMYFICRNYIGKYKTALKI